MRIDVRYQPDNVMLQPARLLAILAVLVLGPSLALAQSVVKGVVISGEDDEPLPGVNIVVKGTTNGTVTDVDGNYSLRVNDPSDTLVFSYVGFISEEIPLRSRTQLDMVLMPDLATLSEVVVVGYGTVNKSDLTGAVSSVRPEDMTAGANLSVEQMLQGRAPGVVIKSKSGEPGGAININIRGASSITAGNEPLYVIDGLPFDNQAPITGTGRGFVGSQNPRNPLNALNPNDIASIEILKDASATAIYGSRGSNGVVLITTKSGASAAGLRVNYNYAYSLQEIAEKYEMLNATQYREVLNGILEEGGFFGEPSVAPFQGEGTDWAELLYRDGEIMEHNLSVSGGNDNTDFYASLSYFDQEGILINSGIERYIARFNLNTGQTGKYKVGMNVNTTYIHDDFLSNGIGINDNGGALYSAINFDPTVTRIIDPFTGRYTLVDDRLVLDNPLALAYGENAEAKTFRTFGSVFAEYFILPGLSIKGKLGGNVTNARRDVWIDPITRDGFATGGVGTIINSIRTNYLTEFTANFDRRFDIHNITAVAGVTYEQYNGFNNDGSGSGFGFPDLETDALGSGVDSLQFVGSSSAGYKLLSYLGRVNYSLKDRYLVTLTGRLDGSSRFGENNQFGFFPSAAVAWKMHQEDFLLDNPVISQLKLRASYGAIGNQAIGNYLYIPSLSPGKDAFLGGVFNPTIVPTRLPNNNLQWESALQLDVGVDFGLWQDRVQGTVDYYIRDTENLLLAVPQPPSTGFNIRTENVGSMRNSGLEVALDVSVLSSDDFSWNVTTNFSTLDNVVTDLGNVGTYTQGGVGFIDNAGIVAVDTALFSFYGYQVEGVWQEGDDFSTTNPGVRPGDWKYRDVNGDSVITPEDRVILGKPLPDFQWGLTNTFRYKNLSLSVFIEGSHGNSVLNANLVDSYFPIEFRRNKIAEPYLNRWTEDNPTNEYSSFVNPFSANTDTRVNSKTVEDASFVRLQSVRLSYDLPITELGWDFVDRLNVYFVGQNLVTITDYSGVDPGANSLGNGLIPIDFNSYPFARTYTLGVNIGL